MSTGDGGGVAHIGFSKNGTIEHNSILFNQSTNPTITTNGGGLLVMGAPDVDPTTCGVTTDKDCVIADPSTVTPSDGTGPGLKINANLILGNSADSGSGGGLRLQHVNGTDVVNFPNGGSTGVCTADLSSCAWNSANITNNIIVNNVAGWDGGGVSLLDALAVNIVNDTISSNDSTASSGTLFSSLFAPLASSTPPPAGQVSCTGGSASCPQIAGLVSVTNSPILQANIPAGFSCPQGHGTSGGGAGDSSCKSFSDPLLYNDVIWQNRSFNIGVGAPSGGNQSQQNTVSLFNAAFGVGGPAGSQASIGQCPAASYWEIGVRGDTSPSSHNSGLNLAPTYSLLTDAADYGGAASHNQSSNPNFTHQYCNGSRVPPEDICRDANGQQILCGWQVPPGTNETNALPTPVFTLTPAATVDEGNNWINMRWGPLSLTNPNVKGADGNWGGGAALGDYSLANTGSGAYNAGAPCVGGTGAACTGGVQSPATDFFGATRPQAGAFDIGAVEFGASAGPSATVSPTTLAFGNWHVGSTSGAMFVTVTNTGTVALAGGSFTLVGSPPFARVNNGQFPAGAPNCIATLNVGAKCSIKITFTPAAAVAYNNDSLTVAYTTPGVLITGTPVTLTGTGTNNRATVSIAPNPQTITLQSGQLTASGTVTFTNTSPTDGTGTSTRVTNVLISGNQGFMWFFTPTFPSTDTCTGTGLAPGQSCTVGVEFTSLFATRGVNRAGTITFTDDSSGSPQTGNLIGFATP
jgi:hypothetical protein